jgi:hypothetical protein
MVARSHIVVSQELRSALHWLLLAVTVAAVSSPTWSQSAGPMEMFISRSVAGFDVQRPDGYRTEPFFAGGASCPSIIVNGEFRIRMIDDGMGVRLPNETGSRPQSLMRISLVEVESNRVVSTVLLTFDFGSSARRSIRFPVGARRSLYQLWVQSAWEETLGGRRSVTRGGSNVCNGTTIVVYPLVSELEDAVPLNQTRRGFKVD